MSNKPTLVITKEYKRFNKDKRSNLHVEIQTGIMSSYAAGEVYKKDIDSNNIQGYYEYYEKLFHDQGFEFELTDLSTFQEGLDFNNFHWKFEIYGKGSTEWLRGLINKKDK